MEYEIIEFFLLVQVFVISDEQVGCFYIEGVGSEVLIVIGMFQFCGDEKQFFCINIGQCLIVDIGLQGEVEGIICGYFW